MGEWDYTFVFGDIAPPATVVRMVDHGLGTSRDVWVQMDDEQLARASHQRMPPHIADLIDIGIAAYVADRMSIRREGMQSRIHIVLPLRQKDMIDAEVRDSLCDVLYWYSEDHWSLEFVSRKKLGRQAEIQLPLREGRTPNGNAEIALWSGGLDSLAGLLNRMTAQPDQTYRLFGAGDNSLILSTQRQLLRNARNMMNREAALIQLAWKTESLGRTRRNTSARLRGFAFLLLGAACALLLGQDSLYVYENGVGAINLRYEESETGIDHSRSVHPLSLMRMSDWISKWSNSAFEFRNPFLFWTKAQMCGVLDNTTGRILIAQAISCDSRRREPGTPTQCGFCSSCLLRRQALAASRIPDPTRYAITKAGPGRALSPIAGDYLRAALRQAITLRSLLVAPNPSRELISRYQDLVDIVQLMARKDGRDATSIQEQLTRIYESYTEEWEHIWRNLAAELLSDVEIRYFESKINTPERGRIHE